eukprot:TRINITY_DN25441_c0_g1_i1.p1 TRINITY_DN25441_c0_g1~~TRINITY_DN25441_c0_g1_i1.p1  ORF type:complete len:271 (-),score=52.39 TRINITY_DN25441_c0_g1_i1:554-1366(-)
MGSEESKPLHPAEKYLGGRGEEGVNVLDLEQHSPLWRAASDGDVEAVAWLLDHGATLDAPDKEGSTPLHEAVSNAHVDVVRLLLERGAPQMNGVYDTRRQIEVGTPLVIACKKSAERRAPELARLLLQHGATHEALPNGETPLICACDHQSPGQLELVRVLLENGATHAADKNGWTPLHWACYEGFPEVVRELLEHGASLEARNSHGDTPEGVARLITRRDKLDKRAIILGVIAEHRKAAAAVPQAKDDQSDQSDQSEAATSLMKTLLDE